jgi:microsomal dipeptidase-like Zn-dependent dipeptidase
MSKNNYYADIHLHPTLKAFNSGSPKAKKNIWEDIHHKSAKTNSGKFVENNSPGIAKYSQSNFYELAKGNVRAATVSLYPLEKGFMQLRNIPSLMVNMRAKDEMMQVINGYDIESIKYLRTHNDYFDELEQEYQYLQKQKRQSPDGAYAFELVNSYSELKSVIDNDDHTLGIILAVEGAHALLNEKLLSGKLSISEAKKEISENIGKMKSWEVPPLSMNLSHHFYNTLCGHSKSLAGATGALLNQIKGLELGLTGLGIKTLKELVSQNNGKRVIIDTKHMSVKGRIEYYNWIRSYNYISKSDKIPIICSHTGVSGYKTMKGGARVPDNAAKMNKHYFNKWNINLSDEEIVIIHESTGLIGVMLDKHKLGGGLFFKQHLTKVTEADKIRDAYLKIFIDNMLQVVKVLGKPGWDIVCLGSDYDGAIEHADPYDKSSTMPQLASDLQHFLEQNQYERAMWHGYTPEELVDKIMRKNVMDFYERHFV